MNVYMTEEEQIQMMKRWWKDYGSTVISTILMFVIAYFGWQWWQRREVTIATQASVAYEQLLQDAANNDQTGIQAHANSIISQYSKTPYADLAALFLAREHIANKEYPEATKHLNNVVKNANSKAIQQIARIRLARVYMAEKQFDTALNTLKQVDDKSFQPLISEVKGDIYLASGDNALARKAYESAIQDFPNASVSRPILQMKLDNLAEKVPVAERLSGDTA